MYGARKNVLENRAITPILKGEMYFATETRLDEQDRWAGGVSFPPARPAPFIVELMNLTTDSDLRFWRDDSQACVVETEVWGHYDEARSHERSNLNQGNRLKVSTRFITNTLAKLNRDLIIEIQIGRTRRYQPYESSLGDDDERVPTQAKLYLLNRDGKISTI
jgi:hypothetical protein